MGADYHSTKTYSDETAGLIDEEVKHIIESAFAEAEKILSEHIDKLHVVAQALLELETLDGTQFEQLYAQEIDAEGLAKQVKDEEEQRRERNAVEAAERERLDAEAVVREEDALAAYDEDYLHLAGDDEKPKHL